MRSEVHSCNCIGPQNGQPLCPCMMRGVVVQDGHYIKTQDLGPVTPRRETCPPHKEAGKLTEDNQDMVVVCERCGKTLRVLPRTDNA